MITRMQEWKLREFGDTLIIEGWVKLAKSIVYENDIPQWNSVKDESPDDADCFVLDQIRIKLHKLGNAKFEDVENGVVRVKPHRSHPWVELVKPEDPDAVENFVNDMKLRQV